MTSQTLDDVIPVNRLPSGHRLAQIVCKLAAPACVPDSALRRYPFLKKDSFEIGGRAPPVMSDDGVVSQYLLSLSLLIVILSLGTAMWGSCVGKLGDLREHPDKFQGKVLGGLGWPRAQL
eukprot:7338307-Pyramimonas_sp.AAC.1